MDIRSFKLNTGEEIVARLIKETGMGFLVVNPLTVHIMRGQDGNGGLAFAKWSMVRKDGIEFELYYHSVAGEPVAVIDEVAESYIQHNSSIALSKAAVSQILQG